MNVVPINKKQIELQQDIKERIIRLENLYIQLGCNPLFKLDRIFSSSKLFNVFNKFFNLTFRHTEARPSTFPCFKCNKVRSYVNQKKIRIFKNWLFKNCKMFHVNLLCYFKKAKVFLKNSVK